MSIDDIYAKVPDVHCKGLCHEACGPIMMSDAEQKRIQERHGFIPSAPIQRIAFTGGVDAFTCSALKDGRCSIYEDRPLVCRLFGAVRGNPLMKCEFGCKATLPDHKARKLLRQMGAL